MPTAFLTGANGFLGATLARRLIAQGYDVRTLLRPDANEQLIADLPLARISGDLLDPASYGVALAGCDLLFHLAASYTHDPKRLAEMEQINVAGTRHILQAAIDAGVPRILHTSTIGVIGQPEDGSLASEDTPFNLPHPTAYVLSKQAGEQVAAGLAAAGAPIVIVHPTGMLGAGDWRPTASGRLVLDALQNRFHRYPPAGVNWCPVADVAQGMILAAEKGLPGRRYILGHRQGNLNAQEFGQLIAAASDAPLPQPPRPNLRARLRDWLAQPSASPTESAGASPARLTCDPSRAVLELGMPQSSLLDAARQSVQWYRSHGYA